MTPDNEVREQSARYAVGKATFSGSGMRPILILEGETVIDDRRRTG